MKKEYKNQYYKDYFSLGYLGHQNHECPHCGKKFMFDYKKNKQICPKCRLYNFKNKKEEFIYRFKETLNRNKLQESQVM